MAIRAFLTTWALVADEIHNPILDHIDTQPNMGIILSMIYPDADANGLPDKPVVLVMVESNQVAGAVLEQLKNVAGVTLIPGQRPDKTIATIAPSVRNDMDGLVALYKLPQSVVTGATTYGDFLGSISRYISPDAVGLERYLALRPAEFG